MWTALRAQVSLEHNDSALEAVGEESQRWTRINFEEKLLQHFAKTFNSCLTPSEEATWTRKLLSCSLSWNQTRKLLTKFRAELLRDSSLDDVQDVNQNFEYDLEDPSDVESDEKEESLTFDEEIIEEESDTEPEEEWNNAEDGEDILSD